MKGIDIIKDMGPCDGSIPYMESKEDFYQAWNECERGDWMLWMAHKLGVGFKYMVKVNAMCALTVRHLMTDQRSINYCQIALLFADGEATIQDLKEAAKKAEIAAKNSWIDTISKNKAIYIASTDTSATTSYAAAAAASVVNAAYHTAKAVISHSSEYKIERKRNQKETADICWEILTEEVFKLWKENHESNL